MHDILTQEQPSEAIPDIEAGIEVLSSVFGEFNKTRAKIETIGVVDRWDFRATKQVFTKNRHMETVLRDLLYICQLTCESSTIPREKLVKLSNFPSDIFEPENS